MDRKAAERERDRRRLSEIETRRLYTLARWLKIRAQQLLAFPLCELCELAGKTAPANVCDHVTPHHGDPDKFWTGPFLSLCKPCQDSVKQREEQEARRRG